MTELLRPNWIEISLDGLLENLRNLRKLLPTGTRLLLPVKADAYGHGSLACSYAAQLAGVDYLGVAHLGEGILLRQYGIVLPILVLGPSVPADFPHIVEQGLTPTLASLETAQAFSTFLGSHGPYAAHLKVDSGMHRYGLPATDLASIATVLRLPGIEWEGIYSHLATSDEPNHPWTSLQIDRFTNLVHILADMGICPPVRHLANSAAVLKHPNLALDMVRPGLAAYGLNPFGSNIPTAVPLVPVLRMRATVRQLHIVPQGEGVSYGQRWTADHSTLVASVAIGYGDGFPRGPGQQGHFMVRGIPCPILGRVCMDTTMLDVSHVPGISVGDMVDVIDSSVDASISMEVLAERHGTIPYELTCHVARRLYRRYWWNGTLMRWDDLKHELGVKEIVNV